MASRPLSRRDAIRHLTASALGVAGAGACQRAPAGPPVKASVPLAGLADGARALLDVGGFPVEVMRQGEVVSARYLLCTHMGCRVTWDEATSRYLCPCHDGAFAADGRPLLGPATEPLQAVPFTLEGEAVVFR